MIPICMALLMMVAILVTIILPLFGHIYTSMIPRPSTQRIEGLEPRLVKIGNQHIPEGIQVDVWKIAYKATYSLTGPVGPGENIAGAIKQGRIAHTKNGVTKTVVRFERDTIAQLCEYSASRVEHYGESTDPTLMARSSRDPSPSDDPEILTTEGYFLLYGKWPAGEYTLYLELDNINREFPNVDGFDATIRFEPFGISPDNGMDLTRYTAKQINNANIAEVKQIVGAAIYVAIANVEHMAIDNVGLPAETIDAYREKWALKFGNEPITADFIAFSLGFDFVSEHDMTFNLNTPTNTVLVGMRMGYGQDRIVGDDQAELAEVDPSDPRVF